MSYHLPRKVRKSLRKKLWIAGRVLAPMVLGVLRFMPRNALHALAACIGFIWYYLIPSSRDLGLDNLDLAFGESLSKNQKAFFCRESFRNVLTCMMDYYYFSFRTDSINSSVLVDDATEQKIISVIEKGKGALIFSAHMGNWELLASYLSRFSHANILARSHKKFGIFVEDCRIRHSVDTIPDDSISSMKRILQKLHRGEMIGFILDRNLKNATGIMVDFMGRPAFTPYYPVKLALRSGTPVVGAFLIKENSHYRLYFEDPVEIKPLDSLESTYKFYTQHFLEVTERYIRKHPEQWFWAHKRWGRAKGTVAFN